MAQLTVGLDLGNESLKRVRLKSSFRAVEVVDFTRIPLAQDERPYPERLAEALEQLGAADPNDLVATALPGSIVSVRTLQLPFSDNKRIAQTFGFELESQIPFALDQVVYDFLKIGRSGEGVQLLAAVCQIEQMRRWIDALKTAGLDPRLVGADCLAYSSLAEFLGGAAQGDDGEEAGPVAVVDIGHRLTSVCIMGPSGVEFGRTLSGGGFDATARLAETFKLDWEQAQAGKHRGSYLETSGRAAHDPEQVMISDALRRPMDLLIRELRQTLATHRTLAEKPVERIWLCGGGAAIGNLERYVAEQLELEVARLEPQHITLEGMDRLVEVDPPGSAITWAKALGLALHAHQGGRRGWLNLRRGPFAFKSDFVAMRGKAVQVAVTLAILALLAIGNALVSYFSLRSTDKTLDQRIRETTQAVLGKPYDNIEQALAIIREKTSPEADPLPRSTALDSLATFHEKVPKELKVRLRDINISPTRIRIEGFTDTFDSVEKIKAAMEQVECFTEVKTGKTRRTRDETEVEFELTIASGC
jgi:type IV pilus assembly protein PilM